MKYFMVRREWSQTDQDNIIIRATSKEAIQKFYKDLGVERGPRYITVYETEAPNIFELTPSGLKKI
jgi:hypothetical protein